MAPNMRLTPVSARTPSRSSGLVPDRVGEEDLGNHTVDRTHTGLVGFSHRAEQQGKH